MLNDRRCAPLFYRTSKRLALGGCSMLAALAAAPAQAQSAPSPDTPATVQEVVITANKREERLNRVGLTVTAISAATLSNRKITTLDDISSIVPGMTFSHSGSNTPILTLRGVGYNSAALGSYPAVSVYVDQVPLPFPVLATHAAYDLQQVEVLKGPQGTLFGENATGGAINFIAAKPTRTFAEGADVTVGRFDDVEANAYVSGPITDTLRARIAGSAVDSDGWQVSSSRPDDHNGAQRYDAGRLLLDWDASQSLRFELNLNGWIDQSQPQAGQFIAMHPIVPGFLTASEMAAPFSPQNPQAADWSTGAGTPRSDRKFFQAALRTDVDLTDSITLTALTSYDAFTQLQTEDHDGLPLNIDDFQENGNIYSFNQEIRVANHASSRLRWVVGANYENSKTYDYQFETLHDNSLNNPYYAFLDEAVQYTRQTIQNYAVFGNADYDITPALTIKSGIRYTDTHNAASMCAADAGDGTVAALFNNLGEAYGGGAPFTHVGSTGPLDQRCASINKQGVPNIAPTDLTLAENNVSWRVGLDYRFSAEALLYANISRGYKAGSFPTTSATSVVEFVPVTQESVTAYEAGLKTDLLDRRVHLDVAAFYYDYRNKQSLGQEDDPLFGPQPALVNVPKSRIYGVDSDITIKPISGLTLTGSVTYLNSRIDSFTGYNAFAALKNFAGSPLPFTPEWGYGLDVDYRYPLPNAGTPFVGLSVQGRSSQDTAIGSGDLAVPAAPGARVLPGLTYPFTTNPYATLDVRLGYQAATGAWKIVAFGKNVLNKYYWNNVLDGSEAYIRFAGMPATYGVTLSVALK